MFFDLLDRTIIFISKLLYLKLIDMEVDSYHRLTKRAQKKCLLVHKMMSDYEEFFDEELE